MKIEKCFRLTSREIASNPDNSYVILCILHCSFEMLVKLLWRLLFYSKSQREISSLSIVKRNVQSCSLSFVRTSAFVDPTLYKHCARHQ